MSPLGASNALKFFKNGLEMRKLRPPQSRWGQERKEKNRAQNTTKPVPEHLQKLVLCCSVALLQFQDDL